MPRIAERRNWMPGPSAQVDWSNPLTARLRGYGCFYEEWCHIGRREYPTEFPDTDGSIARSSGPWGGGLQVSNTADRVVSYRVLGTMLEATTMMTWVMPEDATSRGVAMAVGNGSGGYGIRMGVGHATNSLGTDGNSFTGHQTNYGDGGYMLTGTDMGVGFHSLAVAGVEGANSGWYIDGGYVASILRASDPALSPWYIEVAGADASSFYEWLGITGPWAAWERELTANEIARLHADPFQMLRR